MEPLKSPPMMQSIAGTTCAEPAGGRGLPTTADTAAALDAPAATAGPTSLTEDFTELAELAALADTPDTGTTGATTEGGRGLPPPRSTAVQHVAVVEAAGTTTTPSSPDVAATAAHAATLALQWLATLVGSDLVDEY